MMNETKRNEIENFCDSLTHLDAIELCKELIAENEELKTEIEYLKAKLWLLGFQSIG